jgi:PAS domain S-box-containing protein
MSLDMICIADINTATFVKINPAFTDILGYSEDELLGRPFLDFIHPEDIEHTLSVIEKKLQKGEKVINFKNRYRCKNGRYRWLNWVSHPVPEQGITYAVAHDITEEKETADALQESEEKYRLLFDNANDAIFIAQDGRIKFPNPKTIKITGYSREELESIPFVELLHPEDREMVVDRHKRRMSGETNLPTTYSFRIQSKGGEELLMELSAVPVEWEGRPATLNFVRDISRQKRMETQLLQAQKMESLGTLAGGIAHNFNNILMGILGRTSLMMLKRDASDPDYEHLKGIEEYVQNANELTRDLLGFARGGKYEVKPTDLNALIKHENRMFGRTKKEIRIHGKYEKELWAVEVDQGQIRQVILNLYVNAWQAMPGGGDLYIQTENILEEYATSLDISPGQYVRISVSDTGVGMDQATKEKIFDPFFSTKDIGGGSGLGLASVYGIVKNHGGMIHVDSKKGEGTTFHIYLPATETEAAAKRPEAGTLEILYGEGTVLLVDDEEMIIQVGQHLLENLGYRVLVAKSGKEAVDLYGKRKKEIDLVILDLIMPGMGGGETFDRLKAIDRDVKVLLSSGYSINGNAKDILDRGCKDFIQKPFTIHELSRKLKQILD